MNSNSKIIKLLIKWRLIQNSYEIFNHNSLLILSIEIIDFFFNTYKRRNII